MRFYAHTITDTVYAAHCTTF